MTPQLWFFFAILAAFLILSVFYHDWVWKNTDQLTKWLQIVALGVAGFWAYTRFFASEAPSLERLANVRGDLHAQQSVIPGTCMLTYRVTIGNLGIVSFDVATVRIKAWSFDLRQVLLKTPAYVDLKEIEGKTEAVVDKLFTSGFIEGHYTPKTAHDETFSWVFAASTPATYLFSAEASDRNGGLLDSAQQYDIDNCKPRQPQ
jgi:hypothetical protein